ncbi:MAG: hypothetical protein FWF77_09755 [Defluviitaleaceae bacterium]|nr:hypothetical protein [Defluviitaleaceae bacterium]
MPYQINRVHLLICVLAGTVITGGFVWLIFFDLPHATFRMIFWINVTLVAFYFIGQFARSYLLANVFVPIEDGFNLEEDEEYKAFVAQLEAQGADSIDLMVEEPLELVDPLDDDFIDDFQVPEEAL